MAERLDSVEQRTKSVPKEIEEEEKAEEGEVDPPRVVDLMGSDDGEKSDDSSCQHSLKNRLVCVRDTDGATSKGEDQQTAAVSRKLTAGRLPPGSYDIVLCVDFIETTG